MGSMALTGLKDKNKILNLMILEDGSEWISEYSSKHINHHYFTGTVFMIRFSAKLVHSLTSAIFCCVILVRC